MGSGKNMRWKLCTIILCCAIFLTMWNPNIVKAGASIPYSYKNVGETENLKLYYDEEQNFIAVLDKRNNFVWGSPATLNQYNVENIGKPLQESMSSLFKFSYTSTEQNKGRIVETNCASEDAKITWDTIDNGIRINFEFTNLGLCISIEIWLEDDSMIVRIPIDKIIEKDQWGLVKLELLPFFGATEMGVDGYIFFPDGSGSLLYFNRKPKENPQKHTFYVYGTDIVDISKIKREKNHTMIPVYGVKNQDNAFLAIIEEGDCDSAINLYPSGYILDLNRITSEFTYRRLYKDPRDEELEGRIEKQIMGHDNQVKYIFMVGENANYSGMANTYRDYLIENKEINQSVQVDGDIPVNIDLFMGIKEKRILLDKFIVTTTFEQAQEILDEFVDRGLKNIDANLIGWQKGGYGEYSIPLTPERRLGGVSGLKKLSNYTSEKDISLYLQSNLVNLTKNSKGFSPRRDVVYQGNSMVVTDIDKSNFLLNPIAAWNSFKNKSIKEMCKFDIDGLNFEFFGRQLFHDYNASYPLGRSETSKYWNNVIEESKKEFGYAATTGGNAYVFRHVCRLSDIPTSDTDYFVSDESIPFYQMVVHGLIPYSSDEPGNLFYDFPRQKLKWVEYGCMPYFKLTYETSDVLKNTNYNHLFTSYYLDWIDTIVEVYNEFNDRLKSTWLQTILKHEKVADDVYIVTYEDGSKIYVNYREKPFKIDGNTINALDYLVIDREGNIK